MRKGTILNERLNVMGDYFEVREDYDSFEKSLSDSVVDGNLESELASGSSEMSMTRKDCRKFT